MGNNASAQEGTATNGDNASIAHVTLLSVTQNRYLEVRYDDAVHANAFQPNIYTRYVMEQEWDGEKTVVRFHMLSSATPRFLGVSPNLNPVPLSERTDLGTQWLLHKVVSPQQQQQPQQPQGQQQQQSVQDDQIYRLQSVATALFLTVVEGGNLRLVQEPPITATGCHFKLSHESLPRKKLEKMREGGKFLTSFLPRKEPKDIPPATITEADKAAYHRDGFCICRNLIPEHVVAAAKAKIQVGFDQNAQIAKGFLGIGAGRQSWPKEYSQSPEVMDIATYALRNCEALTDAVCKMPPSGQIALRQKTADGSKDFGVALDWHIDAYEKFTAARFGVLIVVALSDWPHDNMGNFTVYPGAHHTVANMMKTMSWSEWNQAVKNSVDLGVAPVQLHVKAGDVILAHPLLAHDVAPNLTDHIRWAVIFRPQFQARQHREEVLNPTATLQATVSSNDCQGPPSTTA